jgi:hypothetical protein
MLLPAKTSQTTRKKNSPPQTSPPSPTQHQTKYSGNNCDVTCIFSCQPVFIRPPPPSSVLRLRASGPLLSVSLFFPRVPSSLLADRNVLLVHHLSNPPKSSAFVTSHSPLATDTICAENFSECLTCAPACYYSLLRHPRPHFTPTQRTCQTVCKPRQKPPPPFRPPAVGRRRVRASADADGLVVTTVAPFLLSVCV